MVFAHKCHRCFRVIGSPHAGWCGKREENVDPYRNDHDAAVRRGDALEAENRELRKKLEGHARPTKTPKERRKIKVNWTKVKRSIGGAGLVLFLLSLVAGVGFGIWSCMGYFEGQREKSRQLEEKARSIYEDQRDAGATGARCWHSKDDTVRAGCTIYYNNFMKRTLECDPAGCYFEM